MYVPDEYAEHLTDKALLHLRSAIRWNEWGPGRQDWPDAGYCFETWDTGACHIVSECLATWIPGAERVAGCYVSPHDHIQAHYWIELPGGIILDPTADQFDDGGDIRWTSKNDPRYIENCACEDSLIPAI